jgi:hypothetical protein
MSATGRCVAGRAAAAPIDSRVRLARMVGNRAFTQMVAQQVLARQPDPAGKDAASIIHHHLRTWYENVHFGLDRADLSGDDDAKKWFVVALVGNLAWAATAFLNPALVADVALAKLLSVGGATVGSGTLQQLHGKSDAELRELMVTDLSAKMTAMETSSDLIDRVNDAFDRQGLSEPKDSQQTLRRYEVAWKVLFGDRLPYANDAAIERMARKDAEAISAAFWKRYWALISLFKHAPRRYLQEHYPDLPITSRGHRIPLDEADRNWPYYIEGLYYLAIVDSGVADRMPEIAQESDPGGTRYNFPDDRAMVFFEHLGDPYQLGFREDDPLAGIDVTVLDDKGKRHVLEPLSP